MRSTLNLINPDIDNSIQDLKDNKTTRIVKYVIGNTPYYLATNLYDEHSLPSVETEFSIVKLKQLYHKRWTVEEAFKYIKRNFNFGLSELKSADAIRKSICCQVIIMKLTNILACIGRKKIIKTNKQCNRNNIKDNRIINKSTITHGLFNHLLFVIFNDVLSRRTFNNFLTNYIVLITTNKGKRALHICITPYFKWFFKQHTINANKQKAAKAAKKAAKKVAEKID